MSWVAAHHRVRRYKSDEFEKALLNAEVTEENGDSLGADLQRADVFYQHFFQDRNPLKAFWGLILARWYVREAVHAAHQGDLSRFTADQCGIVSSALLASWFCIKARPTEAIPFLWAGFDKPGRPHTKAAICAGLAEVNQLLGRSDLCSSFLVAAVGCETAVLAEDDHRARKAFVQSLCRGLVLYEKLGCSKEAEGCYRRASKLVSGKFYAETQLPLLQKLQLQWDRFRHPRWWHRFLPQ